MYASLKTGIFGSYLKLSIPQMLVTSVEVDNTHEWMTIKRAIGI